MKKRLLTIVLVFGSVALFAQSKIGSNAGTLQSGQLLELEKQGNRAGLKIAEVALTGNNDVTTVKLPSDNTKAKGTLIWNTATVAGGNAVSPGFYVWTGTLWERVNTGTVVPTVSNSSNTNSLTTTVNGVTGTAVSIINGNTLTAASNAITSTVNGVTATLSPASGTVAESLGFNAAGDLVKQTANAANTPNIYTTDGTINGDRTITIANGGTMYITGQNNSIVNSGTGTNANLRLQGATSSAVLDIGNTTAAPYLQASNATDLSNSLPLLLNPNGGRVGIGNTTPAEALDVTGNVRLSGALMPGGAAGTTGQILTSAGAGAAPTWASASSLPVTVSNASSTNSLTTTVNGVTGAAVNIINSNALAATNGSLVSTVNGQASSGVNVLTSASSGLTAASGDVKLGGTLGAATTITTDATNTLAIAGLQTGSSSDRIVVADATSGVLKQVAASSIPTTVANTVTAPNSLTTTVNGVTGTAVNMVTGVSNTSSTNSLTTTVNGVTGTAVNIINGNTLTAASNAITSTVNGVASVLTPTAGGTIAENLGFNAAGNLVRQTASAANTPNIYTADGTLTGARTITMGSNSLNFRSNSASTLAYFTYGRTATEMDMGVAGANDNGLDGVVPGDSWLAGTNNLYVGTRGTGSFRVVTGAAGSGVTRLFVNNAGRVGVGTTSPSQILDVNGVAKATRFTNGATAISGGNDFGIYNQDAANAWTRYVVQSGSHAFFTDGASGNNFYGATASMLLNSTGLGIGTGNTAASERLQVNGNIRFSGALMPNNAAGTSGQVLTSAGAGAAPTWTTPTTSQNIYNTDGTFTGARTVNMAGNFLNFLSNNAGSTAYMSFGRTAVEMDMGVSGGAGGGIGGTVAGDTWFKSLNNLFVGTIGAGSINFITGTSPGTNRMRITSAGNVGIGTTSPAYKLDVSGNGSFSGILNINGQTGQPPASGTATNAAIRVATNNADGNVLDIGTFTSPGVSGVAAYLQSTDKSNVGTGYAILLNPRGGNVGIGGFGPTQRLDVGGTIKGTNLTNGTTALSTGDFGLYSQNNNWMRYVTAGGNHMFFTDGDSNNSFSGSTAAMALTSAGRLGVGTTAPLAPLHVRGTNAQPATTGVVPTSALRIDGGTHTLDIGVLSTSPWGAYIQSANGNVSSGDLGTGMPLILQPVAGQIGVGIYSPNVKLHVANGNIAATAGGNVTSNVGGGAGTTTGVVLEQFGKISAEGDAINMTLSKPTSSFATANAYVAFLSNGAEIGKIHTTNRSTITYTTTSDVRLKENIVPTHFGLADVNKIKVYDYNFKADADKTQEAGFLAQELYKIYPQAVAVGGDDPKKNPWAVDYGKLTPLLVKAIQEQQLQIEALKKEIENLKNK